MLSRERPSESRYARTQVWTVQAEREVEEWLNTLPAKQLARAKGHIDRLATEGNTLGPPISKSLKRGLFELRFTLVGTHRRITYRFADNRRIVLLTTFTKQRSSERTQVDRARRALEQSIHTEASQP